MTDDKQLPAVIPTRPTGLIAINSMEDLTALSNVIARSGLAGAVTNETLAKKVAEVAVKIMAGHEYGLTPYQSMKAFHIVQGKPVEAYQFVAQRIKTSGKYDFKTILYTDERCTLEFFENGKALTPLITWGKEETERAQMSEKDNYKHYPRRMNFARCVTEGANVHCSEIFGGMPVHCPEDFGVVIDAETPTVTETPQEVDTKKKSKTSAKESVKNTAASSTSEPTTSLSEVSTTDPNVGTTATDVACSEPETATDATVLEEAPKSEPVTSLPPTENAGNADTQVAQESTSVGTNTADATVASESTSANTSLNPDSKPAKPGQKEINELVQLGEDLKIGRGEVNTILWNVIQQSKCIPDGVAPSQFAQYWNWDIYNTVKAGVQKLAKK